jgi:hypothetical protein
VVSRDPAAQTKKITGSCAPNIRDYIIRDLHIIGELIMTDQTTRNEIKQLAKTLESLAREIQVKLDAGADILPVANEIVRSNSSFVFTLGEMYALEQLGRITRSTKTVASGSSSSRNYHNVRDSLGRFTRV